MYKIVPVMDYSYLPGSGPTRNDALPSGNDYAADNGVLMANIVEITALVLKNICENTSYEVISDSELGGPAVKSLIVARLHQKIKEKSFSDALKV